MKGKQGNLNRSAMERELWEELNDGSEEGGEALTPEQMNRLVEGLSRFTVEPPKADDTKRLAAALSARWEEGRQAAAGRKRRKLSELGLLVHLMSWLRPQIRLFAWPFWVVSAAIVLIGGLLGSLFGEINAAQPLVFVTPLLAALSVCYVFRSFGTPMFELELSMPVSPIQLVFGRLTLIVAYDVVLTTLVSLLAKHPADVGAFIASWLIPLGVSSLAALVVMLYYGILSGLLMSVFVWAVQLILNERLGMLYIFSGESYPDWLASKLIGFGLIVVLCLLAWHKSAKLRVPERVTG